MNIAVSFGCVASVMLLSACMGGDSEESLESRVERGVQLADRVSAAPGTDATAMPTSGTASYRGMAAFADGTTYSDITQAAVGDLSMTADFAAASVAGSIDRLQDAETRRQLPGAISLNGSITGSAIAGSVGGRVDGAAVTGTFDGEFAGAGHEFVRGEMSGSVGGQGYAGIFGGEKR